MNFIIFIATALLSLVLTPALIRLSSHYGISHHGPSGRVRSRALNLSGGVVIYLSFIAVTGAAFLFNRERLLGFYDYHYLGVLLGGTLMILLGLRDAIRKVHWPLKIAVTALAGLILVSCGYRLDTVTFLAGDKISLGPAGALLLVAWVTGMVNAFALIDTIDGLAAGIAAIAAATIFFAALTGPPFVPVLALATVGGCAGFLRYNFYPARIHLGRTGTFFLGFLLAAIAAQGEFKATAGIALILPILALVFAIFGRPPAPASPAGRNPRPRQIADRLLLLGYSPRQVVLLIYLLQANLGMIALVAAAAGRILALGIFFLVGSMLYLLFRIVEEYRSRILVLDGEEPGESR